MYSKVKAMEHTTKIKLGVQNKDEELGERDIYWTTAISLTCNDASTSLAYWRLRGISPRLSIGGAKMADSTQAKMVGKIRFVTHLF